MVILEIQLCQDFFKSREKITELTEFLSGIADLSHGLCDTNIENLFVVQSGSVSPNPTALLQSKKFCGYGKDFFKRGQYIELVETIKYIIFYSFGYQISPPEAPQLTA